MSLEAFSHAYIEAALWSSTDDNGDPLDTGKYELAPETLKRMQVDAAHFYASHADRFDNCVSSLSDSFAGHDFWLTRNGHGAGFWDGDWPEPNATILTAASHAYGECNLYVGDDGLIYAA